MNSKLSFIIGTYFHSQNIEKCKKDKIVTLFFPKFVSLSFLCFRRTQNIWNFFLEILLRKILIDSRKEVFIFIKNYWFWMNELTCSNWKNGLSCSKWYSTEKDEKVTYRHMPKSYSQSCFHIFQLLTCLKNAYAMMYGDFW